MNGGYRVTYRWRDDPEGKYRHQSVHHSLDQKEQFAAAEQSVKILMRPPQRCQEAFIEVLSDGAWVRLEQDA